MIAGVKIKEFKDIVNEQGGIQHMLRADDEFFSGFGEIYFSIVNPGVTKGWHRQAEQTNILSCIRGTVKLVLYDTRDGSATKGVWQEIQFGDGERKLVLIPPNVTYGWRCLSATPAFLANCANKTHDPVKSMKIGLDEIPYNW